MHPQRREQRWPTGRYTGWRFRRSFVAGRRGSASAASPAGWGQTVRRYIDAAEAAGLTPDGPEPSEEQLAALATLSLSGPRQVEAPSEELLSPWAEQIERWLETDRLQLTRIQELLAGRGCEVSYTTLRRFIRRRGWRHRLPSTVRMDDGPPGEVAEMDFGRLGFIRDPESGRRRAVWALVVVWRYSRHCFVWPTTSQKLDAVIEGLEEAWAFFGGVPRYLVIDNFPAAVAGADALHPRFTRGFLEYARHRGFITDPARVRHPRDKPRVERSIPYVRERLFKGGDFRDVVDLRSAARSWCLEVAGQRIHGTTRRRPLEVFLKEELPLLAPWDGEPYEVPDWRTATVHPDHHIACQYALYSVPSMACPPRQKVEVQLGSKLVRIYHRGQLIKVHPRQRRGGRATDPNDYPAELTPYTRRAPDWIQRRAAELGEAVGAYAERLFEGSLPWAKLRQGHKLLRLAERYSPDRLDAACRRALEVDLIDVRRLERILVRALDQESTPDQPELPPPPGRFAHSGSVFAQSRTQTPTGAPR